ncbi:MAG: FAD-dependent oxidoreductase [Acidimicrobiia bacterium]|nr:FAD-dependent oxidoreductase [Acidimicrobiia bacterium]
MSRVVVVGAGPAGLLAADEVARRGHDCVVVEADDHVGGMSASIEVAGLRVDLGSHRLHPATPPELLGRIEALLGDELQLRRRNGRIRLRDRWVAFPLAPADLARRLPPSVGFGIAADLARAPWRRAAGDTFVDDVAYRLGPTIAREFYGPYARKLYGVDPGELDAELARRRVSAPSGAALVGRALRRGSSRRTFYYPRRGYGAIAERLADAAVRAGARIELGWPVGGLTLDAADGARVQRRDGSASETADVVLWSAPLPVLARALGEVPPPVAAALAEQRNRAMLLVYLVLDRARFSPYDAHYLPDPAGRVTRLSEPKNYRDGPDPDGVTVLCAEIPAWRDEALWDASADDLGALVTAELAAVGLQDAVPSAVEVRRLDSVYPVYRHRHRAGRQLVEAWARSHPRLVCFGRQGLDVPDNIHHVLAMGRDVAAVVDAHGRIDRQRWLEHECDYAANVVED